MIKIPHGSFTLKDAYSNSGASYYLKLFTGTAASCSAV